MLAKKNYTAYGEFHYVMPYNIIFRHSDGMVSRMWRAATNIAPRDAEDIALGKRKNLDFLKRYKAVSKIFEIERPTIKKIGKGFRVDEKSCARV